MTSFFIEESNVKGLGFSLLLIAVVCSLFYSFALPAQAGEYNRERYERRVQNKKKAARRQHKAAADRKKQEEEKEHYRKLERQQRPLQSQASKQDFINLAVDASDWFLDSFGHLWLSLREMMSNFKIEIPDWSAWAPSFDCVKYYTLIKDSDVGKSLLELIDYVVAIGWIDRIELKLKGVPVFCTNRVQQRVTFPQLMEKAISLLQLIYERVAAVVASGSLESFFASEQRNAYDVEFTFLKSHKVLIDLGRGNEIDEVTYDRRVQECIEVTASLINTAPKSERAYYSSRLAILKDIQSARTLDKKEHIREKPYGMLLYGDSGVGKSAIVNSLLRYVLKVNGKDYSPKAIITLNQEDKFQSEFRTHHKGVILDDICNTNLDRVDGSPATPIIMFLNQVPMSALNPNAEMKGMVMIEPDVVCATTNVKTLKSNELSNEPLSINRRFEVTITQKVKPEYRKDKTTMLDNGKIEHMSGEQFPDYATFTVEEPYYAESQTNDVTVESRKRKIAYAPMFHKGKELTDVDIYTLLEFLKENSQNHYRKQKAFVEGQRKLKDMPLCPHDRPPGHCHECEAVETEECSEEEQLVSQIGIPYYEEVKEYLLSLEEQACQWWMETKRAMITSKYGTYILAFLMRDVLKRIVLDSISNYVVAVVMLIFIELAHGIPSAIALIGVTLIYASYIAVKFYAVRRKAVEDFIAVTKPSKYLIEMTWETKKKVMAFMVSVGIWKFLVFLARKWKTLPSKQAAAPIKLTPDAKPYQKTVEFWDTHAQERAYKIGTAGTTHTARTTTHEQIKSVVGKKLMIVMKEDGTQCNALPVKGNVLLVPNHIVPSGTEFVTLKMVGGHLMKNIPLAKGACYRIPGTDLALWYSAAVGPQKDLVPYYPEKINTGKKIEVYTLYNDDGALKQYPKMMAFRERVVTTEGGIFAGLKYTFPEDTFGGLCMATLIGTAGDVPFIAGHHLAGRGTTGAAGFVSREQIEAGIKDLDGRPGVLISHSATPLETTSMKVDFGPLTRPHDKCPTKNLQPEAKIRVHGGHNQPRSTPKSAVVTSLISGAVKEVMKIEKKHGPPKGMGDARHKVLDLEGKVDTASKFDVDLSSKAYVDYCAKLDTIPKEELKKVGKISDDANLAGMDGVLGINAINFSTSIGFPMKGPKTQLVKESDRKVEGISCPRDVDPMILEEVAKLEKKLLNGESINAIFKGSLKDEPTKLNKDKVRVFAAANFPFVFLVRKYYLSLAALCQRNKNVTECAVGTVVQSPEWTELFEHIGKHGWDRAIAGDYAKFDGRMSPQFMLMAFKLLIHLAEKSGNYEKDDLTIMRGIASEISYPTYDYFGTLVQFMGSNPSGHPLTVVINSLVNSLYMRYTYYSIAKKRRWWRVPRFDQVVSLMTYGDDNIMTVAKGYDDFNHTAIAQELADVDIKYTMADKDAESVPFVNLADASFLKHYAKYDEDLKLYRSPVEEDSIAKMLHAHKKSEVLSMEQSSAEAIQNVALKYFEFGREVYTQRVAELKQVAEKTGLSGYVGPIMDYDERKKWYVEKFGLESQAGYKHEKAECTVNSEEEQLQLKAMAEMPLKCTAKEYDFPGGRSGDLLYVASFMNVMVVVEVKCCSAANGKKDKAKFKRVKEQAIDFGNAMHALYPKNAVYAVIYTYDGFELVGKHNVHKGRLQEHNIKLPFL